MADDEKTKIIEKYMTELDKLAGQFPDFDGRFEFAKDLVKGAVEAAAVCDVDSLMNEVNRMAFLSGDVDPVLAREKSFSMRSRLIEDLKKLVTNTCFVSSK